MDHVDINFEEDPYVEDYYTVQIISARDGLPSLTEWGMIVLVVLMLIAGAMVIRRQRAMSRA